MMRGFNSVAFFRITKHLAIFTNFQFVGDPAEFEPIGDKHLAVIQKLSADLAEVRLDVAAQHVKNIPKRQGLTNTDFQFEMKALERVIEAELEAKVWFHVPQSSLPYLYGEIEAVFGEKVTKQFPELEYDLVEACKCFGVNRFTACVFHLMRAVELSLKGFVGIYPSINPLTVSYAPKNWMALTEELSKAIRAEKPTSAEEKRNQKDRQIAVDRFQNLADARNRTAHPGESYSESQALDYLNHVKAFLDKLADAI